MRESRYWILFLASGVLMLFLLGIHLFLMHFGALAALGAPTPCSTAPSSPGRTA